MVSYGFSDKFNLSVKGWISVDDSFSDPRPGFSLTGQFIRQSSPNSKWVIIPRIGSANFGDGYGLRQNGPDK